MPYVDFITDEKLETVVAKVISRATSAIAQVDQNINNNSLDPFSALFDVSTRNISLEEWYKKEKSRQIQKTLQNAVGNFHEEILGNMDGWTYVHNVIDIANHDKKNNCRNQKQTQYY